MTREEFKAYFQDKLVRAYEQSRQIEEDRMVEERVEKENHGTE
jgi:hypothetical protein